MTYTPASVAPPARGPWVVADVASAALDVLRLDPTDDDAARIGVDADRATRLVDLELDDEVPPAVVDPLAFGAAVSLTVELYRRKDSPFGITDSWAVDGASIRVSSDVMRGVRSELGKIRSRRGVA